MLFHCGYERFEVCMCVRALNDKRVIWNFIESSPWHGHEPAGGKNFVSNFSHFGPIEFFRWPTKRQNFPNLPRFIFSLKPVLFVFSFFFPLFVKVWKIELKWKFCVKKVLLQICAQNVRWILLNQLQVKNLHLQKVSIKVRALK